VTGDLMCSIPARMGGCLLPPNLPIANIAAGYLNGRIYVPGGSIRPAEREP
jgi:hypothetical protein